MRRAAFRDALGLEPGQRLRFELAEHARHSARSKAPAFCRQVRVNSALRLETSSPSAESTPGPGGTTMVRMPSSRASAPPCSGPGAAEGQQREVARVVAALHRHHADGADHVVVDDGKDAARGGFDAHAERLGDAPCARRVRRLDIEREAAAEQVGRQVPERQMRVRDGRLDAAAAVADRARLGAGALRPDDQRAGLRDARDRAAARPDRDDVDHGQADRPAADAAVGGEARLAAVDQGDVGRGAADVDADEVLRARRWRRRSPRRRRRPPGRTAPSRPARAHGARAGDAAARLHEQERRRDALLVDARDRAARRRPRPPA